MTNFAPKRGRLDGKSVLVFGAGSSGPGFSNGNTCAICYAREGAVVLAVDKYMDRAEAICGIVLSEGNKAIPFQADVCIEDDIRRAIEFAEKEFGKIDILHNNVGISVFGELTELTIEDWDRSMHANVRSVFLSCKYALPEMVRRRTGVITNISSILAVRVSSYPAFAYYASKAAVNHLTQAVASRYARSGIRSNAILPGLIDTPLLYANQDIAESGHGSVDKMIEERNASSPTAKMGEPWDVANAAVFLASDEARYISGILLPVDGSLIVRLSEGRVSYGHPIDTANTDDGC
jgi:NAD(P)-dependent dehydrogenase (short-subunit alcohol dehydrogenase family)